MALPLLGGAVCGILLGVLVRMHWTPSPRYRPGIAYTTVDAAAALRSLVTAGPKPLLVGAVPNFDADRIAHQLGVTGWSHRLRCVETLTAGHLGREVGGLGACCKALGIEHRDPHTALGDVRAARDIWDHIITRQETS